MRNLILVNLIVLTLLSCTGLAGGPGTLGAIAENELNCSENHLQYELDKLSATDQFKTSIEDTTIIDWWKSGGYDFLNYKCLNIKEKLYMITIISENSSTTNISIRSFYNRRKKEWMFAYEFNSTEKYNAEKAMENLLNHISGCP